MSSKQVDFLVRLRDAFTMAAEATNDYVESLAPPGVREEKAAWNPEKIAWTQKTGQRGLYEQSEDVNNTEFKTMHKDIAAHNSKLMRDGFFYWVFTNGVTVGRKKRSP
jgi:hypothetical protein